MQVFLSFVCVGQGRWSVPRLGKWSVDSSSSDALAGPRCLFAIGNAMRGWLLEAVGKEVWWSRRLRILKGWRRCMSRSPPGMA